MIDYRPCGECRELVPATGCEHWRPRDMKIGKRVRPPTVRSAEAREADRIRQKERRARERAALDELRRQLGAR